MWVIYAGTTPTDSNSWLKSFSSSDSDSKNQIKRANHFQISTSTYGIMMGETELFKTTKPLRQKMIHCSEALQSEHISQIIWFIVWLQIVWRKSFELALNFGRDWQLAIGSTDRKSFDSDWNFTWLPIIRSRSFRLGLQSADHESFDYDRNFRMGLQIFWFTLELRSADRESLLLLKIGTLEWVHKSFDLDQGPHL